MEPQLLNPYRNLISTPQVSNMMSANTQEPQFEPLRCQSRAQCTYEKPFSPVAHDLIIMGQDGRSKIARNASVGQMINVLSRLSSCSDAGRSNDSMIGSLIIV